MDFTDTLWSEWPVNKRRAQFYALRCMSHRFRKFGFEKSVNLLDAKSLLCLGMISHEPMASACVAEAIRKDPSIESVIATLRSVTV